MQSAHAYHVTEFHNGGNPSWPALMPAPESPFVQTFCCSSALSASSVSELLHPLPMVLKGRDYGFIRVKLKDLIFHERSNQQSRGIHRPVNNGIAGNRPSGNVVFKNAQAEFEQAAGQ